MTDLGYEHGRYVIDNEERKPLLVDAKDRPLVREVGFRPVTGDRTPDRDATM